MSKIKAKESIIGQLLNSPVKPGKVAWISVRPERRAPVKSLSEVEAIQDKGLAGDHYRGTAFSTRHITLIQAEHLMAVASFLNLPNLDPGLVRRNIVVQGINLLALKDKQFYIGEALLETTGLCHPCSQMEEILGKGGYNAMRGHGGVTAKIISGGRIRVGDEVYVKSVE